MFPNRSGEKAPVSRVTRKTALLMAWFYALDIFANIAGVSICIIYFRYFVFSPAESLLWSVGIPLFVALILVVVGFLIRYSWKATLVSVVERIAAGREVPKAEKEIARRNILNLPVYSGTFGLVSWGVGGLVLAAIHFWHFSSDTGIQIAMLQASRVFFGAMLAGLITSTIITFSLENLCRSIRPALFPSGKMGQIPGAIRFNLKPRLLLTFFLTSVIPLVLMAFASYNRLKSAIMENPAQALSDLLTLTLFIVGIGLASVMLISRLFASSILRPLADIEKALKQIEAGRLDVVLPVYSYDEFGMMMDHFNRMILGLQERYRMRQSLNMAMEVQRNLLPERTPAVEGLDLGMVSVYCDETGGDYLDFITAGADHPDELIVVVGDVSDHGISSALLMASARAYLRMRCTMPGSLAQMVIDLNSHLCRDVGSSGRFITLFAARIHPQTGVFVWCNAGHDPPMLWNRGTRTIRELRGAHLPLGIDETEAYGESADMLQAGDVLVLFTDGLWEARNAEGEFFGKERMKQIIDHDGGEAAQRLVDCLVESHRQFTADMPQEDDLTLLVVRKT
jgi:sigma-B regulation protein RsbU (phosphoserine phosphatase)